MSEISPNLLFGEKFRQNKDISSELLELSHFRLIMDFRWFLFPIGVIWGKQPKKLTIRWGLKTVAKTVFIGILTEKNSVNSTFFFNFSGLEKVRRLIVSLKGVQKGIFPLSLSVKTPRPPCGATLQNLVFVLRNVQGDCTVDVLTCVREPRRRSQFRSRLSAPLIARNRVKLVWLDFGINNKCRRYISQQYTRVRRKWARWAVIQVTWSAED